MTMRSALRMSSNRAAVQMLNTIGIPRRRRLRAEAERRHAAQRAVAGARRERRHAAVADRGLRRVRRTTGIVRTPVLIRRVEDSDGKVLYQDPGSRSAPSSESTAFLMSSMLADVINQRHRLQGAAGRLHAAGGGEDRHDQRIRGRVVRRFHAAAS